MNFKLLSARASCQWLPRALACLLVLVAMHCLALAEEDEEDLGREYLPGLVAAYSGSDGHTHERVDNAIAFDWGSHPPDGRVPSGPFQAQWRGRLFTAVPGVYKLHVHAIGHVSLKLDSKSLLDQQSDVETWMPATAIDLAYGYHPIELTYRSSGNRGRIALFWEGPRFQLEPTPPHSLFHDASQTVGNDFANGQLLAHALRCGACHAYPQRLETLPAPALTELAGNIDPQWLAQWIQKPGHKSNDEDERGSQDSVRLAKMPDFGLSREDAEAITAFLLNNPTVQRAVLQNAPDATLTADPAVGKTLFLTIGCLACHQSGDLRSEGLFGGGDLSAIGDKRPPHFFEPWLSDPRSLNPDHRMPVFRLSEQERIDLAAHLATLTRRVPQRSAPPAVSPLASPKELIDRGRKLVDQHRCNACHRLPEGSPPRETTRLSLHPLPEPDGCLDAPVAGRRPGYRLTLQQKADLKRFLADGKPAKSNTATSGELILAEKNCLSCHPRGLTRGIAERLPAVIAQHGELSPQVPALTPPSLSGVGDKLQDQSLAAAVTGASPALRPWLRVRMPQFSLNDSESTALVTYLQTTDRIPDHPAAALTRLSEDAARIAGSRLVTSDGFGCVSCHKVGSFVPKNVALNAQGTDLSLLGTRLRRPWFDRWVRNPARIVPQMEMPSVQTPIHGVLNDDLGQQLAAVWHVLNQPGFEPPPAGAIRTVRNSNVPERVEPAIVLSDLLELGQRVLAKPLVIGLANRHTLLFDLEKNAIAAWHVGDVARQWVRGKSWYWEPAGISAWEFNSAESDIRLVRDSKVISPVRRGQFLTECDSWELIPNGLRFTQRLHFPDQDEPVDVTTAHVEQELTAILAETNPAVTSGQQSRSGVHRRIRVSGIPSGQTVLLTVSPIQGEMQGINTIVAKVAGSRSEIRLVSPVGATLEQSEAGWQVRLPVSSGGKAACELTYLTTLPVDQFPVVLPPPPAPPAATLAVIPGFEVTRLSIPDGIMPTGMAWTADGSLHFSSLKGQVWTATDTDSDGLEDSLKLFADGLAAPYGLAVQNNAIDAITKSALVRLTDSDNDGQADRSSILASGWGHTTDYHDWAVGLERDAHGNYYIALPCHQDDRSPDAAYLRGTGLRLTPCKPTPNNPRLYALDPFCAGLRFPMGLAVNLSGDIFATDNQGNHNPFNELNQLRPNRRYGFVNKSEWRKDFNPPVEPPAIDIPHPWTRSVNGICFLHTPDELRQKLGRDHFGPWEGHLVGCEYDSRQLVRMSLQKVGDTYQGAVYPMTTPPSANDESLEGPLVCEVAPNGDIYIGNIRDSGWGGGANTGSIARLKLIDKLPPGIAEVRAERDGFTIAFATAVSPDLAREASNYSIESYRRESTSAYGGPDLDRRTETIRSIALAADNRIVSISLANLRPGFLYEFRLKPLTPPGALFHPSEAYYTLRTIPK